MSSFIFRGFLIGSSFGVFAVLAGFMRPAEGIVFGATMGLLAGLTTARLHEKRQEKLRKEKHRLVKNGIFQSKIYELVSARLTAEYNQEVDLIKECLLFYLRYSMKPNNSIVSSVPYVVDYSLSDEERLAIVKAYYEGQFPNAVERFEAFKQDAVAPQYLGELYAPLYTYYYVEP